MIRKTKHPTNKAERRAIGKKKDLHSNASPVFKLLKQKELLDAETQRVTASSAGAKVKDNRDLSEW